MAEENMEWRVDDHADFDPGDCRSSAKFYILYQIDEHGKLSSRELSELSGMPVERAGSYLSRFRRMYLLRQEDTVGPSAAPYYLTERGESRLQHFKTEYW
ncbi:MAG: hypothetical protein ABEI86_14415, partial [Halobacteriaceae archaeon]